MHVLEKAVAGQRLESRLLRPGVVVAENREDGRVVVAERAAEGREARAQKLGEEVAGSVVRERVREEVAAEEEHGRSLPPHRREQLVVTVRSAVKVGGEEAPRDRHRVLSPIMAGFRCAEGAAQPSDAPVAEVQGTWVTG